MNFSNIIPTGFIVFAALLSGCGADKPPTNLHPSTQEFRFFYQDFIRDEGIPVVEAFSVAELENLELGEWPRRNARGTYIKLHGQQGITGAYVLEIEPGQSTNPERHIYEEVLYVLSGNGETQLWNSTQVDNKIKIEHQAGALFSPPMNNWHSHTNTGNTPLRLVAFTSAPTVMDLYRDADFVLNNSHNFTKRWQGDPEYFAPGPKASDNYSRGFGNTYDPYRINFVPDVFALNDLMYEWKEKNADFAIFAMSDNSLSPHLSAWPAEDYQTAHHHNGGSVIMLLQGEGYYLMWPSQAGAQPFADGHEDVVIRGELKPGGMYSPPEGWYHQHFNTSETPGLYLALTPHGRTNRLEFVRKTHNPIVFDLEARAADYPTLIELDDEDKNIAKLFETALKARD